MLFSGCCAVSDTPAVCVWVRSFMRARVLGAVALLHPCAPRCGARRGTWRSPRRSRCARRRRTRGAARSRRRRGPRATPRSHVGEAVGEREGELLRRRRAGLADVVAADRDRVPARHLARRTRSCRVTMRIAGASAGRPRVLRLVLLQDVVLHRAAAACGRCPLVGDRAT
jgi:hypothetical protein